MSNGPRVLLEGADWRIVRVQVPDNRREGPDDDGWRDWIEFADGADLMGQRRWTQLEKRSAGVSDYSRAVNALKAELIKRLENG